MKNIFYGMGAVFTIGYTQLMIFAWMAGYDSMAQFFTSL